MALRSRSRVTAVALVCGLVAGLSCCGKEASREPEPASRPEQRPVGETWDRDEHLRGSLAEFPYGEWWARVGPTLWLLTTSESRCVLGVAENEDVTVLDVYIGYPKKTVRRPDGRTVELPDSNRLRFVIGWPDRELIWTGRFALTQDETWRVWKGLPQGEVLDGIRIEEVIGSGGPSEVPFVLARWSEHDPQSQLTREDLRVLRDLRRALRASEDTSGQRRK